MPIEQRVISGNKIGASKPAGPIAAKEPTAPEPEAKKGRRGLLVVIAVLALAAVAAAVYFFLPRGDAGADDQGPEPGVVVDVDPVSLNLADGHYLRLGFALQLTADVGEELPETSEAIDIAIALFSGRTVAEVSDPATRDALKVQFAEQLAQAYDGEVMDVYLTNYVTQ